MKRIHLCLSDWASSRGGTFQAESIGPQNHICHSLSTYQQSPLTSSIVSTASAQPFPSAQPSTTSDQYQPRTVSPIKTVSRSTFPIIINRSGTHSPTSHMFFPHSPYPSGTMKYTFLSLFSTFLQEKNEKCKLIEAMSWNYKSWSQKRAWKASNKWEKLKKS